ncbi:MAG: VWA domain-containing protein [Bacteroidia bacterium]|nr:VWA domain-containing protein [Bacteroidia bacterium]
MFRIAHEEYLYVMFAIPVIIVLFLILMVLKKRSSRKFASSKLYDQLASEVSTNKPIIKLLLLCFAVACLSIALAGPQLGSRLTEVKREGVDLIIALDVSKSMMAEDIKPNRLERSKQAISKLIDKLNGDRIGLVIFAGQAYVQLPITTDYAAAKLFLSTVNTNIVPTQGTAIGKALELCIESFADSTRKHSSIILITDGENHEDDAIEAAEKAAELGITVNAIGMGSVNGAPIPVYSNNRRVGFLQDKSGKTVVSKLDQQVLQEIARKGNGKFVRASTSDDGLKVILAEISAMEKQEFGVKMFTDYEEQFQYFLGLALIFLIIEFSMSERKSRWIQKLNLFGGKK